MLNQESQDRSVTMVGTNHVCDASDVSRVYFSSAASGASMTSLYNSNTSLVEKPAARLDSVTLIASRFHSPGGTAGT